MTPNLIKDDANRWTMSNRILVALALLATTLAGCTGNDGSTSTDEGPDLDVTELTGGIRGVVVDGAVRPVTGATVSLISGGSVTTDEKGLFSFVGLEPGDYFVRAEKIAHEPTQSAATVVAGLKNPPMVKMVLLRIPGAEPYQSQYKFDGFYECAFSAEFITDSCDFGVRTIADELNATVGNPGVPRNLQDNRNTQYFHVDGNVQTVIEEAFWEGSAGVDQMMILLGSTPIDNACDCSDIDYIDITQPSPALGRLDGESVPVGLDVAARGFVPWETSTALNHEFTIITTLFHNYQPVEGWNFAEQDLYPIP